MEQARSFSASQRNNGSHALVVPRVPLARNLANTCSGYVSFFGSKLMAMFGFLLAAMVFGLVDATLLVCAATPVAMACAAIFWDGCHDVAQPGLGLVIVACWGFLADCLQPYPRGLLRRLLR